MVDRTDSFMREVGEDVRREQLARIWERYGVLIVAGFVALLAGLLGYQWWKSNTLAGQERAGAEYAAAARLAADGKSDEAVKALDKIAKAGAAGYQALAQLRLAGEHAKAGRVAEALAAYEGLSKGTSGDPLLRDFATLQAAMLRLDQADWTEMKNRLTPLLDEKGAWRAPAREVLGLAAYKAGNFEEATKLFEQILGDKATTQGLSRRAQEMLAVLTDAAAAKSATKAGEPAKGKEPAAAPKK